MTAAPSLLDKLTDYLTRHTELDGERLQGAFDWPSPFAALRESLPAFDWLCAQGTPPRIFGIRPLVDQAPFRLSDLRAQGFKTESVRHPVRPPVKGSVEHYLIAQLVGPQSAVIYLCMYTQSQEWFVLDEHRISRSGG